MIKILFLHILLLFTLSVQAQTLSNLTPLSGTMPELPQTELLPLASQLAKYELVALGESAHGTASYQQMQDRLIRILVSKFNFRTLMMELVSDPSSINHALRTCREEDFRTALYNNPWNDNSGSRLALYKWLCDFNRRNPHNPVVVTAPDPQHPWHDIRGLNDFFPSSLSSLQAAKENCFGASTIHQVDWAFSEEASTYFRERKLPLDKHRACLKAISKMQRLLFFKRASLSAFEYGDLYHHLQSLKSWQYKNYYYFDSVKQSMRVREKTFGKVAIWTWLKNRHLKKKSILIAHNLHITKRKLIAADEQDEWAKLNTVGHQLHQKLRKRFVSIAISGHEVASMYSGNYPIPTSDQSLDLLLSQQDHASFWLVDTKAKWLKKPSTWFLHEESRENGRKYDIAKSFDHILFIKTADAAQNLGEP